LQGAVSFVLATPARLLPLFDLNAALLPERAGGTELAYLSISGTRGSRMSQRYGNYMGWPCVVLIVQMIANNHRSCRATLYIIVESDRSVACNRQIIVERGSERDWLSGLES
jgi:hypothetical protein